MVIANCIYVATLMYVRAVATGPASPVLAGPLFTVSEV